MAEVIAVATMRCLPSIHPIFKVTHYFLLSCLLISSPHGTVPPLEAPSLWNFRVWGEPTNERQVRKTVKVWLALHFQQVTSPSKEVKMIHGQGGGGKDEWWGMRSLASFYV